MRNLIVSLILVAAATAHAGESLDRAAISAGIAKVKAKVLACGDAARIGGTIRLKVTVDADGSVTAAEPTGPDVDLGACIVAAIKAATFAKTSSGGSFSYPFVFGTARDAQGFPGDDPLATVGMPAAPPRQPGDDSLDRSMILAGIAKVRAKIVACGDKTKFGGTVKVRVTVKPDGRVESATQDGAKDVKLAQCVVAAVKTATFAKTSAGGMFSFPFLLAGSLGAQLSRNQIDAALAKAKARIAACGKTATSAVTVTLVIHADGHVVSATPSADTEETIGKCLTAAVTAVRFPESVMGATIEQVFPFGAATMPVVTGELDRATIASAIALVKSRVVACGDRFKTGGTVKVTVVVDSDGKIKSATQEGGWTDLGTCVISVLRQVRFGATTSGGSFRYPFVFGAATAVTPTSPAAPASPASPSPASSDTALDRAAISAGMANVKSKVAACGKPSIHGTVKIKVTVAGDGHVSTASVEATPDAALGECVLAVIKAATFTATQQGGSFSYPLVF